MKNPCWAQVKTSRSQLRYTLFVAATLFFPDGKASHASALVATHQSAAAATQYAYCLLPIKKLTESQRVKRLAAGCNYLYKMKRTDARVISVSF